MNKLVNLCQQVVSATPVSCGDLSNECACPFCDNTGYYTDSLQNIIHEEDCAYLIAKKLLEENKKNEIRVVHLSNPY